MKEGKDLLDLNGISFTKWSVNYNDGYYYFDLFAHDNTSIFSISESRYGFSCISLSKICV